MSACCCTPVSELVKDTFSALLTVGFDPYLGIFYCGKHGRPSLALDLMEEFRAVMPIPWC
jgi:CRISPR-associated protein Cas1